MAACERLIVPIAVLLVLQLTAYASPLEPHLEILPSGETHSKPIGTSIILTCKPKVDQSNLINDMKWLDTRNRTIEPVSLLVLPLKSSHTGQQKPAMYTERYADGSLALFINSLSEDQAGKYSCIGTYANSVMMSKSITIEAIIAITWENAPLDQHPILGENFPIQCQVRARPPPLVDWLYNGELIRTNDRYIIDKFTLTIKNVQESDDGVYTCRASVQATGELKERPIKVEVYTRPSIEESPNPIEIIEGENANIACKASGKPPPTLSWVKSLSRVNLSETDRFGVDPYTGMLTITNVDRNDEGEYQCTAKNPAGDASMNILVNVIVKPKIMEFTNMTVVENKQVDIMCKAFGRPPPEVSFRKFTADKQYVMGEQKNDKRIIIRNNEMKEETVGNMTILNALTSDDGLYECVAKNRGGVAYKNGHLTVEYAPSFRLMSNETIWSWDKRAVNLTCIAQSIPNATIRWTMHGGQKIDNHALIQQMGNGPVSVLSVTPIDNRYYTKYICIATNVHGVREHPIELKEARRPTSLLDVKMAEISATTITFSLIPPEHPDLPVHSITVQYKKMNDIWTHSRNRTWTVDSRYSIEDLTPMTSYDFRFAAMNDVGLGNWGNDFNQVTPGKMAPMQPKILTKNAINEYEISAYNNQYELGWVTPPDNGEPIDHYQIKYCQIRRVSGEWDTLRDTCILTTARTQNRHWLKNLNSDTFYTVELQAHNSMGFSSPGYARFKTSRESLGHTEDYPVISAAGDTSKIAVAAITTAVLLLSLAI